mgnify:FL=1
MTFLVSTLFILEFLLICLIMFYILFKNGVTFKVGLSFGVLFFVFIPILVLIFTGSLEVSKVDFGKTLITDIILSDNIKASLYLVLFIFSIIVYLYAPARYSKIQINNKFNPSIRSYLSIYTIGMIVIFVGSGLLEGGNWFQNRHDFFESSGSFAVLTAFIINSAKILIIASLVYQWIKKEISFLSLTLIYF